MIVHKRIGKAPWQKMPTGFKRTTRAELGAVANKQTMMKAKKCGRRDLHDKSSGGLTAHAPPRRSLRKRPYFPSRSLPKAFARARYDSQQGSEAYASGRLGLEPAHRSCRIEVMGRTRMASGTLGGGVHMHEMGRYLRELSRD